MVEDSRRRPARPVLGVGAIVVESGRVLLVERGREPLKGSWSLPGGAVETGERLEEAIRREVREETGLDVEPVRMVEVFERIMPDAEGKTEYHYVLIDDLCRGTGGALLAASDAARARWTPCEELTEMRMTPGTLDVIRKAMAE